MLRHLPTPELARLSCVHNAAYTNGDGLCRTVHEDCSLLFELKTAPHSLPD